MVDPSTVLTVAKAGYDAARKAIEIADGLQNVELKGAILTLKEKLLERDEEILHLKSQLAELSRKQDIGQNIAFEENLFWLKQDNERQGPFCPKCWVADSKLSPLADDRDFHCWRCAVCNFSESHPNRPRSTRISSRAKSWMDV